MKRLALLRHAKSSWDDAALDDFDRPLNVRGRKAASRMGGELKRRGFRFDFVLASTAVRVRETVEGMAEELDFNGPIEFDPRLYLADEDLLITIVRELPEAAQQPLLVGHNPGLQHLLLKLGSGDDPGLREHVAQKFPTGAFAVIGLRADRWNAVEPGSGRIVELILPKELD